MFLGNDQKVYFIDKVEGNPTQINGHPAWAAEWYVYPANVVVPQRNQHVQGPCLKHGNTNGYDHQRFLLVWDAPSKWIFCNLSVPFPLRHHTVSLIV
jgi:hypothetical protein